jgi:hypothetical protein
VAPDGTVTTFAGRLTQPRGLALDAEGNLYVADGTARGARLLRFIAPAPPSVSGTVANPTTVTVLGQTEAGARVDLVSNGAVAGTTITDDGAFAVVAAVATSEVLVYATAQAVAGSPARPRRSRSSRTSWRRRSPRSCPRTTRSGTSPSPR